MNVLSTRMKLAGFALMIAANSAAAHAGTVTVNHVMDPASVMAFNIAGELLLSPVELGAGDTLDMTITFQNGVSLVVTGEDGLWPLLLSNGSGSTLQVSGTLEFLGASSNIKPGKIPFTGENAFQHIGNYFTSNVYRLDANPITFSGLRQIITINSSDPDQSRSYQSIALTYFTGQVGVGPGAPAIPEPATWAMMIAGFGLVGMAARRRRETAVTA